MAITASMIKDLREKTSAGMLDCKQALDETSGDMEKAIDWLRTKGLSKASKKAGRATTEGLVCSYIHGEGRIGVLLEVNSETDFVARNDMFKDFVRDIAMHIAATNPLCVSEEEIPAHVLQREKEVLMARNRETGKKEAMLEKIVEGQLKKFKSESCLLSQGFVKNPDQTIQTYLKDTIAKIGENLVIRRFVRFELGEGLEKKQDNFAQEVAAQVKG